MNADDIINIQEKIFLGVFFILVFIVPAAVVWATYCENCKFDVRSLWEHQGRIDKFAIIILGTWWIHASSMILWTLSKSVSTADYATFMGWALPLIAKMFAPSSVQQPNNQEAKP